ncbi:hypothetical protein G647_07116 [Cladophialophora carrionii CBS 160.54]|uniref:Uncharacterized protein n=1 Tax=Cladophialophora carrionii CBS 160.54 TaxID=1279043 RepID=V9D1G1_9EURO|nr:uncharacterized protein G647_07116 [Cladophialophora carrionii CBS 160.54]ETI20774.1 hypothetical protein G647_07116 [Cladophialophora carrionii CBS 160.54]
MASAQQVQGHNPSTCPELVAAANAQQKADLVRLDHEQLGKAQRGVTPFLNLHLSDLAASAVLMLDDNRDTITYFDSELEAEKYRERLLPMKPQPDFTIPQTAAEKKAHVKVLFQAFKCVPAECLEGENIKKPFTNHIHDNVMVECLCWEILRRCIQRSQVLSNLVETYEPDKYKFKKFMDKDFEQRFDAIVNAMARSKSMCKHMYDVPYLFKVIDDPQTNVERIDSNRKLNGQKAVVMKRGKEAVAGDEQQGRSKKPKTEVAKTESQSALVPSQPRRQHALPATSTAQTSVYTPPRPRFSSQQAESAPPPGRMAPPVQTGYGRQHLQQSGMRMSNSPYRSTPTPNGDIMLPRAMANNQSPTYTNNYSPSAYMPSSQYSMQPLSQMRTQGYAGRPIMRPYPSQPTSSSSTTRSPSRTSSQYPDPSTPSDQMAIGWLAQPEQDTRTMNSSYNSSASTITSPLNTIDQEQPQWPGDSYQESDLGETCHTSSETHTQDDGFESHQEYAHANIEEFLQRAEEQNASNVAAAENYEDAPFETDRQEPSHM